MESIAAFIILIERRIARQLVSALVVLAQLIGLLHAPMAFAGNSHGQATKVARDLEDALNTAMPHSARWSREIGGQRHVQVVIVSNSSDAEMTDLRADIAKVGGSVHVRLPGLHAVTATLPAEWAVTSPAQSAQAQ